MARERLRPHHIGLLRWAGDPHLSPDGRRVAWSEIGIDTERDEPVSSIFVASTVAGSSAPRRFTSGPHDLMARWSPDGRHLAYLSASGGPPALKIAPLEGGEPVSVGAPGPVKAFAWSPSGDCLVLVVNVGGGRAEKEPRVVRGLFNRLDGLGWLDGRDHLFLHDLGSGTTSQLTFGDYDHGAPAFSPDGQRLAFVSDRSRRRDDWPQMGDIWSLEVDRPRSRPQRLVTDVAAAGALQFSPGGTHLAFTGVLGRDGWVGRSARLHVVASGGGTTPELVAPALDRPTAYTFGSPGYGWLSDDELVLTVADGGTVGIARARVGERTARAVVSGDRQVLGLSVARAPGATSPLVAFSSGWVDAVDEIYVLRLGRGAGEPEQVSRAGAGLAGIHLSPARRYSATAPDGVEVEYFAIEPGGAAPSRPRARRAGSRGAPPLFVEVHGGPAMQNPIVQLMFHYQVLAGAGYTVVLPNPRGSIGYGEKFSAMSIGDWGDGPFGDIEACADDALRRGLGDPSRQYLGGYSYGGYMSAWALGHTTRFRAVAIGAPVTNLVSQSGAADVGPWLAQMVAGDLWSDPDLFHEQSPLTHAPAMRTPALLYVNEGDLRCPPSQCDELYAALRWHRREVEYVRYPGGSHLSFLTMIGVPSQNEDRARRILRLCARHGGEPCGE